MLCYIQQILNFLNLLTEKATLVREPQKVKPIDTDDTTAPEYHIDEKIQMSPLPEVKRIVLIRHLLLFGPCS